MSPVPNGWIEQSLGSVLTFKYGRALPSESRQPGQIPVYGSNGKVGSHIAGLVKGPAIIIGRKGSIGEVHYSAGPCWPIDTTYFVDEFDEHSPQFWFWYLKHLRLDSLDRASAIPGLNREDAYRSLVAVPPPAEQRRIVAKLDKLFDHSNAIRDDLHRIPRLLARYKAGLLADAFSGSRTADSQTFHSVPAPQLPTPSFG